MDTPLLEVRGLKKYFKTPSGNLHAVDNVSFKLSRGGTLGIVGESGCGKTTLGRTVLNLEKATAGSISYQGTELTGLGPKAMKPLRSHMQLIFQDPNSSLDPRSTVSQAIAEPLLEHRICRRGELDGAISHLMEMVGLDQRLYNAYPHELDGGRLQRVGIARALSLNPEFIVCDEPVSALDVSIQAQIINLLMDLQEQKQLTYLFITHDLSVVKHISSEIAVMYLGQIVELCDPDRLFSEPLHPYTAALLTAIPVADLSYRNRKRIHIRGELTSPINPSPGCRFAPRCLNVTDACRRTEQTLRELTPGHFVACCMADR